MSECRGCGKRILWGVTPEGRKIPLDPSAPVYSVVHINGRDECVRTTLHMVSHFVTCPKANDFSASKKGNP
jgi:hypothetical protein